MKNFTKSLGNAIFAILMIFFTWLAFSTVEVMANNITTAEYSAYNFYEVATDFIEGIEK